MLHRICLTGLLALLVFTNVAWSDDPLTRVYLVRHAEKADDGTRDPALTSKGEARACWLAGWFSDKGLKSVYSSDYKRTRETASPTASTLELPVTLYDPRDLKTLATTLKSHHGNLLVVGHSNTTPGLASILSGSEYPYLGEKAYSEIYILEISESGAVKASIEHSKAVCSH